MELLVFPPLYKEVELHVSNLKVDVLTIRGSPSIEPSKTLLPQTWATKILLVSDGGNALERLLGGLKMRGPADPMYRSSFDSGNWAIEREIVGSTGVPVDEITFRDYLQKFGK